LPPPERKDQYKELIGAFGKKGVQALIIENALPEIEEQAK
jgi:exonuclease SbcC